MKFGVLSTAGIGVNVVIPAIQDTDHTVMAIASRDANRAETVADDLEIPTSYGSYSELLADEELDAVYNPLPNALHGKWTKQAADHGLHVLCEKPLAVNAEEAREIGAYCDTADVTLMEAFMYRYHPRTERATSLAAPATASDDMDSALGAVNHVTAVFRFPLSPGYDIRLDPELAGGALMDVGCYAVSAARLFLGEPEWAFATMHDARNVGVETQLVGTLSFDGGVTATISAGFDSPDDQYYRVIGSDGIMTVEEAFVPRDNTGTSLQYVTEDREVIESFDPTNQYRREVEHFTTCIRTGRRPRTDATDACKTMAIIDALYDSADQAAPVPVKKYRSDSGTAK